MPKISNLPPAEDLTGDEAVVMVQGGKTRRGVLGALVGASIAPYLDAAELAAATAEAASNFYGTAKYGGEGAAVAAGEAGTAIGRLFSVDDGAGNLIYRERTADSSVEVARSVTPAALADRRGASTVGFVQSGPNAADRTVEQELRELTVSAKQFGAFGDGVANDTFSLQRAIDSLGILGGKIDLGRASRYLITQADGSGACLNIIRPVSLLGKGGIFTAINPDPDLDDAVTNLRFVPADVPGDFTRIENIFVGDPSNGTRGGGVAIYMATNNPGITLGRILVEGVFTAAGAAQGFVHDNIEEANHTGGLFCSEFRRNVWVGGMRFGNGTDGTGDSLLFTTNTTTGIGGGVDFTGTIDESGNTPSQAIFLNHNSTSHEGAFRFKRANFPTVQNANMEQVVPFAGGALVNFSGESKPNNSTGVRAPSLTNSLVSAFTGVNLGSLVYFGSCSGGVCFNNWFADGGGGASTDIVISEDAHDVWIGPNLSLQMDLRIVDQGVGTRGVTRVLPLTNGWIAPGNGAASLYYWKDIDGAVHIAGGLKNGSTAGGVVIATLPIGFRPAEIEFFSSPCLDNGSFAVSATMSIHPNGEIQIAYCPTAGGENAQTLWPKAVFRAVHANTITIPSPYVV